MRRPLPDLRGTYAEMERIESGIVRHEIAVRDWRLSQGRR